MAGYDDAKLHLQILGQERRISFRVRVGEASAMDLLPPARALSEELTRIALDHARAQGDAVSCGPGCAACCRQLIPVSSIEAHAIAALVASMPADRRAVVEARFAEALARLTAAGLLEGKAAEGRSELRGHAGAAHRVNRRYLELQMACPFLENEACSIYVDRPMVCREHYVTTPAAWCLKLDPRIEGIMRPASMSEALADAAHAITGLPERRIPLVLALEWSSAHGAVLDAPRNGEPMARSLLAAVGRQG